MNRLHLLKKFRAWIERHHDSLSSFVSSFTATVLGIGLTLGSTMWYDNKKKKEAAEALVERCLSNMEMRLGNLNGVVSLYDRQNHLLSMATSMPLDSLTDAEVSELIELFALQYNLVIDHSYEKSFSMSTSSHEILGSFANVIGAGFEYLHDAEEKHQKVNDLKGELRRSMIVDKQVSFDLNSMRQFVTATLSDPLFGYFQYEYVQQEHTVRQYQHYLEFFIPEAHRLWMGEISVEEFWTKTREHWNKRE
ncbi:MAG: hypothetical protein Q4A15_10470 [Prevotellaceae bacterium]|nr:hypothetical protein [Prevotellaceae bacterium]